MSDSLVQFQDWIAQFPGWMVAGMIGFMVVVVAILFWKAMKIAFTALIVAVVVAGGWFLWEHISGSSPPKPEPRSTVPPTYHIEPAPAPAHGATPAQTPAPAHPPVSTP